MQPLSKIRVSSQSESGFTLVELLVVMLILGLLAAIAIAAFLGQRDKARDADAKSSARTAQTAIEAYATDNQGSYGGVDFGALQGIESTLNDAPNAAAATAAPSAGGEGYAIDVTSDTGNVFTITRMPNGTKSLTCTESASGGCPAGGIWG